MVFGVQNIPKGGTTEMIFNAYIYDIDRMAKNSAHQTVSSDM